MAEQRTNRFRTNVPGGPTYSKSVACRDGVLGGISDETTVWMAWP
jgi:hypothetical protein